MPAYGRALFDARLAGQHPLTAWVILGDDWGRLPADFPAVCIGDDWLPGTTDWRLLAGLPVRVVCRWPWSEDQDHPLGWLPFLSLLGELAQVAAPVVAYWQDADWPGRWQRCAADAADLARAAAMQLSAPALGACPRGEWQTCVRRRVQQWPAPWSWGLLDDYERRAGVWQRAPLHISATAEAA